MNIFKTWWNNMGKVKAIETDDWCQQHDMQTSLYCGSKESSDAFNIPALQTRIQSLRRALVKIAEEKIEFTKDDFEIQLSALLDANTCLALQKSLPNSVEGITRKVQMQFNSEYAKLFLIAFGERTMTPEQAEEKYADYLRDEK